MSSRSKWHSYERQLAIEYRELWFTDCITSRAWNKQFDEFWVDLLNTWNYAIQSKSYKSFSAMDIFKALDKIPKKLWIPIVHVKITSKWELVWFFLKDILDIWFDFSIEWKWISCFKILKNLKDYNTIKIIIKDNEPILTMSKKTWYNYLSDKDKNNNVLINDLMNFYNNFILGNEIYNENIILNELENLINKYK